MVGLPSKAFLFWNYADLHYSLRAVDNGFIVIPKSVHKERILENGDIFDFKLTEEELADMKTWNTDSATGWQPQEWA